MHSITVKVYRKPTHDQYLIWESNHHLEHKRSVVKSLLRRADHLVSDPSDRELREDKTRQIGTGSIRLQTNWALTIPG